ncbi:MAG: hypothetical protein U5K37_02175 [Natrialbaceae archaeon]|nr:hypothetical protein [Natrialbaceae archaeon]
MANVFRRGFLASLGVAGTAGCLGWSEQGRLVRQVDGGASGDPPAGIEIHVDIWTVGALAPDDPAVAGVHPGPRATRGDARRLVRGLSMSGCCTPGPGSPAAIDASTSWSTCSKPTRPTPTGSTTQSTAATAISRQRRANSCRRTHGSAWGPSDRYQVTSNSAYNRLYGRKRYMVRSFHHLLHAFVTGETARAAAGLGPEVSGYDAEHSLGTIQPDGYRTVMADRYAYRDEAAAGACTANSTPWRSRWPSITDLGFSPCTRQALKLSATTVRRINR